MPGIYSKCFIGGTRSEGQHFYVCPSGYRAVARGFHVYCYSSSGSGAVAYAGSGPAHLLAFLGLAPGQSRFADCRIVIEAGESFFVAVSNGSFGVHLSGFLLLQSGDQLVADTLPAPGVERPPHPPWAESASVLA